MSEPARAALITAAAAAHPRETGGVLIGVIGHAEARSRWRPWVTHAVEVPSRKSGPTRYELPAGARERTVRRLRKTDERLGYVGDWHSHPIDIDPSGTDEASMAAISATGDCRRPLLIVVRRVTRGYKIDARQWTGASLRRLQVCEAGPLPRAIRPSPIRRFRDAKVRRARRGQR